MYLYIYICVYFIFMYIHTFYDINMYDIYICINMYSMQYLYMWLRLKLHDLDPYPGPTGDPYP